MFQYLKKTWQGIMSDYQQTICHQNKLNVKDRIFDNPKDIAEKSMLSSLALAGIQKWKYQKYQIS